MPHRTAPWGSWPSPVDARLVAAHDGRPEYLGAVGDELWWTAPRPEEGGRRALMRLRPGAEPQSVLPAPWNVRNRVIEYGGQPWAGAPAVSGDGPLVVFTHFPDQRLYLLRPDSGADPVPLTPLSDTGGGLRWCDPVVRPAHGDVVCVLEEFTGEGPTDVRRVLASVPLDGSAAGDRARVGELTGGAHRFLTGARFSPDGRRVAWLAWDHPAMPWDGTVVRAAEVAGDGTFTGARTPLGGPEESVAQVEWASDGALLAATDRTGWWNLHRVDPDTGEAVNLCPRHGCRRRRAPTARTRSSNSTPAAATAGSSQRRTGPPSTPPTCRSRRNAPSPGPVAGTCTRTSTRRATPTTGGRTANCRRT
jgi:hypothetical protein